VNVLRLAALRVPLFCIYVSVIAASSGFAQDYVTATGNPTFSLNIPVESGFINVANGNLHMEIPIANHAQRGTLKLNERLVYDSKIWKIVQNGGYSWQPTNVPNSMAGWRFMTGGEAGITTQTDVGKSIPCDPNNPGYYTTRSHTRFAWTDPSGTTHPFDAGWTTMYSDCDIQPVQESASGWATDASGYSIQVSGLNNSDPDTVTVWDNDGNVVNRDSYPAVIDRFGNYFSQDSNGNLVDTLGRTPVIVTQNGNQTYYDVLAPNGSTTLDSDGLPRVRYTLTTETINVHTGFNQDGVAEFPPGTLTAIKSIELPDGSSYNFTYDSRVLPGDSTPHYGEITSVTLPTGGVIHYGWADYLDSYSNENRWLYTRTVGSDPSTTFTPLAITQCSSGQTGCQEQVTVHKPNGDETVYVLTLNNGAWNTNTYVWDGPVNSTTLAYSINNYDFSQPCTVDGCSGSQYITKTNTITKFFPSTSVSQVQYVYDNPQLGKLTAVKQWDYYNGSPSSIPTREIDYQYSGFDLQQVTTKDSNGLPAAQITYGYTASPSAQPSNVTQHGTFNAGGPYLQTISRSLDTGGSVTTTYGMDDTGMVTSVQDPNQNTPSIITYQCTNALPLLQKNPLGQITSYAFDCNSGAVTNIKGPNDQAGAGTGYKYEAVAGRLQTITYPDGGQATYSYPSANEVDTTVSATPNPAVSIKDIVDSLGRPYQHIQGDTSSETSYDVNGRPSCVTNPHFSTSSSTDGSTCMTTYDGLDRPKVQTQPDSNTLTWSYSANTVTSSDESGNSWQRTSDAFGQLTKVVEPGNLTTTYQYNALGNLTCIDQWGTATVGLPCASAQARSFSYDSLSRLITTSSPEAGIICNGLWTNGVCGNGYDANGNLKVRTDARGFITNYNYDALNRLTSKTYSTSAASTTASSCYQYDTATKGIGLLGVEWTQSGACPSIVPSSYLTRRSILAYDAMGRVMQEQQCHRDKCTTGTPFSQSINYDVAGNRTSYTNGLGSLTFSHGYDGSGRLQGINSSLVDVSHPSSLYYVNSFFPTGAANSATVGLGIYVTNTYDNRLRYTGTTVEHP
jgi:YD repeat-containing protein